MLARLSDSGFHLQIDSNRQEWFKVDNRDNYIATVFTLINTLLCPFRFANNGTMLNMKWRDVSSLLILRKGWKMDN